MAAVIKLISDQKSLDLFNTIAEEDGSNSSKSLGANLNLTRKEYYPRLSALVKLGLLKRQHRKYFLTTFGIIIYHVLLTLCSALQEYWKLKALDSLNNNIPAQERKKIIDLIISNEKIKELVFPTN